ncbi:unnamed protein product [Mucor hiemalis]
MVPEIKEKYHCIPPSAYLNYQIIRILRFLLKLYAKVPSKMQGSWYISVKMLLFFYLFIKWS